MAESHRHKQLVLDSQGVRGEGTHRPDHFSAVTGVSVPCRGVCSLSTGTRPAVLGAGREQHLWVCSLLTLVQEAKLRFGFLSSSCKPWLPSADCSTAPELLLPHSGGLWKLSTVRKTSPVKEGAGIFRLLLIPSFKAGVECLVMECRVRACSPACFDWEAAGPDVKKHNNQQ